MKLYVEAKSKNGIGYTPAWIQFVFNENIEINFDIHGRIDYDEKSLSCKVKGELVPWTLYNLKTNDEVVFTDDTNTIADTDFSIEAVAQSIDWTKPIIVGIWPIDEMADVNSDEISTGNGQLELGEQIFPFKFVAEMIDA